MITANTIRNIYFIGIGGIGMSALARYFHAQGALVSGYDRTRTALTIQLEELGIVIHYDENIDLISKEADIVVYTPAIPANHQELNWYQQNNYKILKRSEMLSIITASSQNICVAGTHGKTTTSTMIAHILRDSNYGCNAFLGGISVNYGTNFWANANNTVVVEADEYDRSFLRLQPEMAVITAVDADHLDIYKSAEAFEDAFVEFAGKIKPGGLLLIKKGLSIAHRIQAPHTISYSVTDSLADVFAENIRAEKGAYYFDVKGKFNVKNVMLPMGGLHNVENAIAAITIAAWLNIETEKIKSALATFKGIKRRFEYILNTERNILIDDYAHHPEELRALISGVRNLYPEKHFTLVFQPHLYSRTADLAADFASVLSLADRIILLPIYPARELPMEGVNSKMLKALMTKENVEVLTPTEMISAVQQMQPELLVMAGAGDIDKLVNDVKNVLKHE